jgi:hypothetical protein
MSPLYDGLAEMSGWHVWLPMQILEQSSARIYRPSFPENNPKTLVFSHTKRAFSPCFRENWVYNFGHRARVRHKESQMKQS